MVAMTSDAREAVHPEPVWRARSDFVIAARLQEDDELEFEQLWARQVAPYRFELCCIPFFLFDMALGDVVETDEDYTVRRVVEPSGRYVFRVWFGDTVFPREEVAQRLTALEALLEWSSANLLAVDARDRDHAQKIADELAAAEARGELRYETGRTS